MQGILMSLLSISLQRYLQIFNILLLFYIAGSVYGAHSLGLGNFAWRVSLQVIWGAWCI